jgi:hypothetical protein
MEEPIVTNLGTVGAVQCPSCGTRTWVAIGSSAPLCNGCKEARQPLLAEIERLKAELAKWEADYEIWKGEGAFG